MTLKKGITEAVTAEAFLNCYLRDIDGVQIVAVDEIDEPELRSMLIARGAPWLARAILPQLRLELLAPVRYRSHTWRHRFDFPMYYRVLEHGPLISLDYLTLSVLTAKELNAPDQNGDADCPYDELIRRVIESCKNIERFVRERNADAEWLHAESLSFIEAEQSVLLGHLLHPTPKSRQGMSDEELSSYAPELQARFALHYFLADRSIVREDSVLAVSASELIAQQLVQDVPPEFHSKFCDRADMAPLPVHPWQASVLLKDPVVKALLQNGRLRYLGAAGREYQPTMSVRTLYHPEAEFMYKLSLGVKITNSVRVNLEKELERGLEIQRILRSEIGSALAHAFPGFRIIGDPAFITLAPDGVVLPGFSTILRENPFVEATAINATPVAALCQDNPFGEQTRLARIVNAIAEREEQSVEKVSREWLNRYTDLLLRPLLWLYSSHGIGLEAHQQNIVIELQGGYPAQVFYRDNQGFYYRRSKYLHLAGIIPGINVKSDTVCDDAVVDERLIYYIFINNLFGLVNAFGSAGLIAEEVLLADLHAQIERVASSGSGEPPPMLDALLTGATLRCKSNLMTCFHNMDELVGPVETQSAYVSVRNPFGEVSHAAA